jgi:hypothetical protein
LSSANVSDSYISNLYNLTGRVNDADISLLVDGVTLPFLEGDLLFKGARGAKRGAGDWEITFYFNASPTMSDFVVAGITVDVKQGQDLLWIYYEIAPDDDMHILVNKAKYVVIDEIYPRGDLSLLNIPHPS